MGYVKQFMSRVKIRAKITLRQQAKIGLEQAFTFRVLCSASERYRPFLTHAVHREVNHFENRITGGKRPTILDRFSQDRVE